MDFEAAILPDTGFLDLVARATPESVLFECWSSAANRVRCVVFVVGGDLLVDPPLVPFALDVLPVFRA
jgi:hypothetical protein